MGYNFVGTDWQDAVGALAPKAMASVATALKANLKQVSNTVEGEQWAHLASQFAEALQRKAALNLDTASKAGLQPSRYIGIDSVAAMAVGAGQVNVNTNEDARIIGFRTDATWAIDFLVTQISIGNRNHIIGNVGVPATAFTTGISLPPMSTPIMKAGAGAVIGVFNRAVVVRQFNALFAAIPVGDDACNAPCA